MKKQLNPTVKAHVIRGAFYVLLLLAVCVIPFALAQRKGIKRSVPYNASHLPSSFRQPGQPEAQPRSKATSGTRISHAPRSGASKQPRKVRMRPSGTTCTYNFTTGTDTIVPGDTNIGSFCDDCDTPVTLPFPFQLYDQTYNAVNLSSNGRADFVCVNEPGGFLSACLPAPDNQCPFDFTIFPLWSDYRTDIVGEGCANFASGCGIFTSVSGSAPNRIFNIEWRAVYFADHNQTANFELRLYENDPDKRFDVVFGTVQPGSDELFVSGVQGAAGAFTQDFCDFNPPAPGSRTYTCPGGPPPVCGLLVGSGMTTGFLPNGWEPTLAGNTVDYTFSNSLPAPNEFALFETHDPWGFTVIKDAITGAGHTFTEFTPADLATVNFSDYSVIILNWDDTNAPDFLADYTAAIPGLEAYINAGGVVWITAAIQTCDSIPMPFGGTGTGCDFGNNDPVVDPASPMMVDMPNPIPGSAANHLSFTGLPAAAHIVVITDTTGFPALYDFRPGENCGGPTPTPTPGGPCTLQPWNVVAPYAIISESVSVSTDGTFAYGVGGFDGVNFVPSNSFNQYDLVNNTWTPLPNIPGAFYDAPSVYVPGTNSIYVFGGIDASFLPSNVVQIYDITAGTWTTGTPMPGPRYFAGAVYYSGNGLVYVAGGFDENFLETTTTWEYDPVANTWNTSRAPIPVGMGGMGYSIVGQNMYLAGTWNGGSGSTLHYRYDIVADAWTQMADVPVNIYRPASGAIDTNTYLVGGGNPFVAPRASPEARKLASTRAPATSYNTTYVYDTLADTWSSGPNTNVAHSFTGGTAVGNSFIVVTGFDGVTGDTNTVEKADCGAGTPTPTPTATPTPTPGGTCPPTITQSTSHDIVSGNSVACNNGFGTTENHYWRAFNMNQFTGGQDYIVTSVSFGIELAQSGTGTGQPLTVNLYANHGSPFPLGDWQSNLIATSGEINIPDQSLTVFNVPLSVTAPGSALELIMEVMTPDGTAVGNLFFVGSNPDPETGLSYLSAADCGVPDPTPTGDLGFPSMHIVFDVNGSCGGTPTPTATPTPTPGTPTPTATPTPTPGTPTPTPTPRATPTPRPRPTPHPRPTP